MTQSEIEMEKLRLHIEKTIKEFEHEREQIEIFNILKDFRTLSEVNNAFGSTTDLGGG